MAADLGSGIPLPAQVKITWSGDYARWVQPPLPTVGRDPAEGTARRTLSPCSHLWEALCCTQKNKKLADLRH